MIHTTIGVYPNRTTKINGVTSENLAAHIEYNVVMRPGRALFVDGHCIYPGTFNWDEIVKIKDVLLSEPVIMTKDTAPYQ